MVDIEKVDIDKVRFFNTSGRSFTLSEVVSRIFTFIQTQPENFYHVIIGSDSDSASITSFVTAISIWRQGNGGIYFWTKNKSTEQLTLRDRIYKETMYSITLAQEVRGRLREVLGEEFFWDDQIHIDVGENGPTKDIKDAVIGMVHGYGFEAAIKPEAFGAFVIADRHT